MKKSIIKRRKRTIPLNGPYVNSTQIPIQSSQLSATHPELLQQPQSANQAYQRQVIQRTQAINQAQKNGSNGDVEMVDSPPTSQANRTIANGHRHFPPPVDFTNFRSTSTNSIQHTRKRSLSVASGADGDQLESLRSSSQLNSINSILNQTTDFIPIEPSLMNMSASLTPEERKKQLLERKKLLEDESLRLKTMLEETEKELAALSTSDEEQIITTTTTTATIQEVSSVPVTG